MQQRFLSSVFLYSTRRRAAGEVGLFGMRAVIAACFFLASLPLAEAASNGTNATSNSARAASSTAASSSGSQKALDLDIRFFRPEFMNRKRRGKEGLLMSGQTEPGIELSFLNSSLELYNEGTKSYNPVPLKKNDFTGLPMLTPASGKFSFGIFVTEGRYRLGFNFVDKKNAERYKKFYIEFKLFGSQLDLIVDDDFFKRQNEDAMIKKLKEEKDALQAELDRRDKEDWREGKQAQVEKKNEKPLDLRELRNYFSASLGADFFLYSKSNSALPLDASFGSFSLPSYRLGTKRVLNPNWSVSGNIIISPGQISSGERIHVNNGSYNWMIFDVDGRYTRPSWRFQLGENQELVVGALGSLQYHSLPHMRSTNDINTDQTMDSSSSLAFGAGAYATYLVNPEWEANLKLRVNYFYTIDSKYKSSSPIAFDGSIGGVYKPPASPWAYGLYWSGAWLGMSVSEYDPYTKTQVQSNENLLYSNFEFRLFYQY